VPSLEIYDRPSALDTLLDTYKAALRAAGKYLTSSGKVRRGRRCRRLSRPSPGNIRGDIFFRAGSDVACVTRAHSQFEFLT
jgi:5'-3' exonuclease